MLQRLEMIMKRVKQDDTSPKSETSSPIRTPKAERSPSPPSVDVAAEINQRMEAEKDQPQIEDSMTESAIEATASPPPERAEIVQETVSTVTPVKALTEEAGPKFKSPLLQQMLGKGRLKLSKENLAEKSSESSSGDSTSAKTSPDKEEQIQIVDGETETVAVEVMASKTITKTVTTIDNEGKETVVQTTETVDVSPEDLAGLDKNQLGKVNVTEFMQDETLIKDTVIEDNSSLLLGDSVNSSQLAQGDTSVREEISIDSSNKTAYEDESRQTVITENNTSEVPSVPSEDLLNVDVGHTSDVDHGLPNGGGHPEELSPSSSQDFNGDVEMRENGQFR